MRKRRIPQSRRALVDRLAMASDAVAAEPLWGALTPSSVELKAVSDAILTGQEQIWAAETHLEGLRAQTDMDFKEGQRLMRLVDHITSALFGATSFLKRRFGIRPIDAVRNSPPAPKAPLKVLLEDGPGPATLTLRWKRVLNARYLVEAWTGAPEAAGSRLIASQSATASRASFPGLTVGMLVFVRVRIIAGKRTGPWSKPLSRYVNA